MNIITDLEKANLILKKYSGAKLQIWMFSRSLKRIAIKLSLDGKPEVVYLIGIGCETFHGDFLLHNAHLHITLERGTDYSDNDITKISDNIVGFELTTSAGFSLAQGVEEEFGDSFENFILRK
ncbi:hypothetical protein [Foetidibacter luteolus]|uniref:hypothetical protein n=1 Tax=Foetidibacter luteolus TaxID=2608880 RepID=UPI00129B3486|nr:hypothetical protein [Foetidibacter luteolus]